MIIQKKAKNVGNLNCTKSAAYDRGRAQQLTIKKIFIT